MLKKTIIGLLIIVLLVSIMVMPVSAAEVKYYNYRNFVNRIDVSGDKTLSYFNFPETINHWTVFSSGSGYLGATQFPSTFKLTISKNQVVSDVTSSLRFLFYPFGNKEYLSLNNVPNGSTFGFDLNYNILALKPFYSIYYAKVILRYYDKDLNALSNQEFTASAQFFGDVLTNVGATKGELNFHLDPAEIVKPDGARYCRFYCYLDQTLGISSMPLDTWLTLELDPESEFYFGILTSYLNEETNKETNEILGDINDNLHGTNQELGEINDSLDELPGEMGDEFQDIIDQENQAASDAGDSAAGELVDLLPNESEGFINAIKNLVSSMSYNGTSAKLPIPAITLPAIEGVMPAIKLTDELSCDFGFWIEKLPSNILQLVRILCTIALIVYCFKELYGTISYALTLKGGGNSE